jgi:hypothetical protein
MEPPVYLIKSRSGEILIHGTAEQVAAWIKEQRLSASDELRRQGWVLYENDQAWSVIEAFPEISGPSAHARLNERKRRNLWILAAAAVLAALGLILISANFLLPAYDASRRIADSEQKALQAEAEAKQAVKVKSAAEVVAKSSVAAAEAEKKAASYAAKRLEEEVAKGAKLQGIIVGLESQLEKIRKTMPIVVRWRESLINKNKVLVVTNGSPRPLKLLVSIYDENGVQTRNQYSLVLAPVGLNGSTEESGVGESVAHYFKKGESVEFTDVDSEKDFRYHPVRRAAP